MKNINLDSLLSQAEDAEVVSFDFFDTLFLRTVIDPEDVFDIVGSIANVQGFREIRRAAQASAFVQMHKEGRKEISLTDIYAHLSIKGISSAQLMQIEVETEKKVSLPNSEIIPFYNQLLSNQKKVIITSDMYLPKEYFEYSLKKFDLKPVDIFVSCETNSTKRDFGELFEYISTSLSVNPEKILHVGDNYVSDVERASERGLKAFHYKNSQIPPAIASIKSTEYSISRGLVKKHPIDLHAESAAALGYHYAGPAAVGFYEWLKKEAVADKIDHVLLVARDGYILDRVSKYDKNPTCSIPFSYFKGSRTVFSLAAITDDNFDSYLPYLLSGSNGMRPSELLVRLNVPLPEAKFFDDLGLSDNVIISAENTHLMQDFLSVMRWEILKVCQENARGLRLSLDKLGIRNGQRVALVDIGWNGTTQEAFENSISNMISLDVVGYYLVLNNSTESLARQRKSYMKAMLSSPAWSNEKIKEFYDNRVAVELLFSAPHHSITALKVENDYSVAARNDIRRSNENPLLETVGVIIQGSEQFASDFYGMASDLNFTFNEYDLISPLYELIANGKWKEEAVFRKATDFDDWALTKRGKKNLVSY